MRILNFFERAIVIVLMAGLAGAAANAQTQKFTSTKHASSAPMVKTETIPITTKSAEARRDYDLGFVHYEDLLKLDSGLDYFRQAVKADPRFALGHAMLGFATFDPIEGERHRALATKYITTATPDERLLIRWMNGTKNGQLVPAIAAMNDLLAKYPNDKELSNMVAAWLCANEQAYDRGSEVLEHALQRDPTFAPAMNNLAYCYALSGRANLAPPLMDKYIAALPGQPNPQDSYAEISRMMGNFPAALEHYNAALSIAPDFTSSQVGLASTYALMGDEERARTEYLKAIAMSKDAPTAMNYRLLWAMTYFRENQIEEGRKAYTEVAAEAHQKGFGIQEAEAHRAIALFNPDAKSALHDLDSARAVLSEKHVLSPEDRDTELASIMQTRTYIAVRANMPEVAKAALQPLSALVRTSRSNLIQQSYHSASGAVLFAQGMYADAISEFQDDARDPLSLQFLVEAETKVGEPAAGHDFLVKLAGINDERVETAFVVPQARAAMKTSPATTVQPAAPPQPAAMVTPAAMTPAAATNARSYGLRGGPLD
ncbi:MAG: tetratricopeptide repeat protein [Candidatus Acidiferrales bacterium]